MISTALILNMLLSMFGLLLRLGSARSCAPHSPTPKLLEACITLEDACMDQQHFISYDSRYQPSLTTERPPSFSLKDLTYNWPNPGGEMVGILQASHASCACSKTAAAGNGDRFHSGQQLRYPPVAIRANTSEEACSDLRASPPLFDACTVPLVLWARWPYNLAEAFATVYARLLRSVEAGDLSKDVMPVMATPHGMRPPKYLGQFFRSLFDRDTLTLAELSNRPPGACGEGDGRNLTSAPAAIGRRSALRSSSTAGSQPPDAGYVFQDQEDRRRDLMGDRLPGSLSSVPGRCFRRTHLCRLRHRDETALVSAARSLARSISKRGVSVADVRPQLPDPMQLRADPSGVQDLWSSTGPGVLRVVFASRPSAESRSWLNEAELLSACNAWSGAVNSGGRRLLGTGEGAASGGRRLVGTGEEAASSWRSLVGTTEETEGAREEAASGAAGYPQVAKQHRAARRVLGGGSTAPGLLWSSARCISRVFGTAQGGGMAADVAVMSGADVLVCVHGAACLNAYFMANGSSLVEVRPLGMSASWANQYFFRQLRQEPLVHWFGIDIHDPANSKPSLLEEQRSPVLNEQVRARERHVRLPWPALKHHLDLIASVARDGAAYQKVYRSGSFYVTEGLRPLPGRPKLPQDNG